MHHNIMIITSGASEPPKNLFFDVFYRRSECTGGNADM